MRLLRTIRLTMVRLLFPEFGKLETQIEQLNASLINHANAYSKLLGAIHELEERVVYLTTTYESLINTIEEMEQQIQDNGILSNLDLKRTSLN